MAAFSTFLRFLKWKMDGKWKMENAHRMGHRQVWRSADFGERPPFAEPLRCHAFDSPVGTGCLWAFMNFRNGGKKEQARGAPRLPRTLI